MKQNIMIILCIVLIFIGIILLSDTLKDNTSVEESDTLTQYSNSYEEYTCNKEVLYQKDIDKTSSIRVVFVDSILGGRSLVAIERTDDGGKTCYNLLQNDDKVVTIHNEAEFLFIDEHIGFIYDPGQVGTNGDYRSLRVTVDGAKTFSEANLHLEDNNLLEYLYIDGLPSTENNQFKLKACLYKDGVKELYFVSDDGLNWRLLN